MSIDQVKAHLETPKKVMNSTQVIWRAKMGIFDRVLIGDRATEAADIFMRVTGLWWKTNCGAQEICTSMEY